MAWPLNLGNVFGTIFFKYVKKAVTEHASFLRFDLSFNFGSSWKDHLNPCLGKNVRAAVERLY